MVVVVGEPQVDTGADLERVLHEEINRLPECYRVPIVLCDLEGCTCEEAAQRMGRPVGTVKSWRSRGRKCLRHRLTRLGVSSSTGAVAALTAAEALAVVPRPTPAETAQIAARVISHRIAAREVPASVHSLVKGVFKTMLLGKLRMAATAALALGFLTAGFAAAARVLADDSRTAAQKPEIEAAGPALVAHPTRTALGLKESDELWSLTLRQTIGIGLDHSKTVRLASLAGKATPFKVAPRNRGIAPARFKSLAMAEVRSIEQQYWNLVQAHAAVRAAERAVASADDVHKKEQAELRAGHATIGDVAEAAARLEQLNLDLVTRTADVITTERALRDLVGLPVADGRRIVPVTVPTDAKIEPDWDQSIGIMHANHPYIAQARAIVQAAEGDVSRDGVEHLERCKASYQQVIHQATHSLARFFLEIDANYKQFRTSSRLRAAAAQRLDAQRAHFEQGRITIDRFLDAVSQYATAVATEAQYKSTYNKSIVALEEAKGTLLEHDEIAVVEDAKSVVSVSGAPDVATVPALLESQTVTPFPPGAPTGPAPPSVQPAPLNALPPVGRVSGIEPRPNDSITEPDPTARTFSFELTLKFGSRPVEIRGSLAITPAPSADGRAR
jgi:hypothetical protein